MLIGLPLLLHFPCPCRAPWVGLKAMPSGYTASNAWSLKAGDSDSVAHSQSNSAVRA
jgi:hypothetical protein